MARLEPLLRLALVALAALASAATRALASVPVYVMLPLTAVSLQGAVDPGLEAQVQKLASGGGGVDGVVVDVWWGVVERAGPRQYNWAPYQSIVAMARSASLSVVAIMSFHRCGGNVGDTCSIPLPPFVTGGDRSVFYTDREGTVDDEYISLGADNATVAGREVVQMYADFMDSFRANVMGGDTAGTVVAVEVSMGPAGELRYPAYKSGTYPGVGEFQSYDRYLAASVAAAASAAGRPEWGRSGGPDNAGSYHDQPDQTGFWSVSGDNNWQSDYGRFFLGWYADQLVAHADRVLGAAARSFSGAGVTLWAKVAGVHWQYKTPQHAAECTAGYYNTNGRDAYAPLAAVMRRHGVGLAFTCLEMFDSDQCGSCGPQELVSQVRAAAAGAGVTFSGENALNVYDSRHYGQIEYQSRTPSDASFFGYLRLGPALLGSSNLGVFAEFVKAMHAE